MLSYKQTLLSGLTLFKNELNEKLKIIGYAQISFANEEIRESRPCLEAVAFIPHQPNYMPYVCEETEVHIIASYSVPLNTPNLTNEIEMVKIERRSLLEKVLNKLIAVYGLKISSEQRELFINPM